MNSIMVQAFADEIVKIAGISGATSTATKPAGGFLRRNAKSIGLLAAGGAAHSVGSDAYGDYRNGRMMRKQNEAAQSMY